MLSSWHGKVMSERTQKGRAIAMRKVSSKAGPVLLKVGMMFSSFVLLFGLSSANAVCQAWFHQPKMPEGMKGFRE